MRAPDISAIVPTYNRCTLLRHTIESCVAQTLDPARFELIIVDDGSTDQTEEMVREMLPRCRFRLLYHRMPRNGGPVLARNAGAKIARAELLAFTDSDCQATPQWLEVAVAAFAAEPDLGFISGPAISNPSQRVRFFSIGGAEIQGEHFTYPLANMVYRAAVLWDAGGFDPTAWRNNFGATAFDFSDTDCAWKVKERGYANRFVEELVVHHEVCLYTPWNWLVHYSRISVLPELVRRHPGFGQRFLYWGVFCLPENPLFYLAIAGLVIAAFGRPWALILLIPCIMRSWQVLRRGRPWTESLVVVAQIVFFNVRQAVICGALIYGSVRARTLVL
ncbi:MAG: glycosyltransferase family 2 protein [Acidobacteria bacterium]|nr:glycosyltransferase family 2 protein [Acidobacteriota bacterium]